MRAPLILLAILCLLCTACSGSSAARLGPLPQLGPDGKVAVPPELQPIYAEIEAAAAAQTGWEPTTVDEFRAQLYYYANGPFAIPLIDMMTVEVLSPAWRASDDLVYSIVEDFGGTLLEYDFDNYRGGRTEVDIQLPRHIQINEAIQLAEYEWSRHGEMVKNIWPSLSTS